MKMDTYYDKKFDYYDGVNYLPLEVSALYTPSDGLSGLPPDRTRVSAPAEA